MFINLLSLIMVLLLGIPETVVPYQELSILPETSIRTTWEFDAVDGVDRKISKHMADMKRLLGPHTLAWIAENYFRQDRPKLKLEKKHAELAAISGTDEASLERKREIRNRYWNVGWYEPSSSGDVIYSCTRHLSEILKKDYLPENIRTSLALIQPLAGSNEIALLRYRREGVTFQITFDYCLIAVIIQGASFSPELTARGRLETIIPRLFIDGDLIIDKGMKDSMLSSDGKRFLTRFKAEELYCLKDGYLNQHPILSAYADDESIIIVFPNFFFAGPRSPSYSDRKHWF